ncbi:MAG: hypothetical protein EBQ89_05820 [Alphaproteobacteria bacterium]|nr:hypothetical protein [Alphaproteobacteria bacterium]
MKKGIDFYFDLTPDQRTQWYEEIKDSNYAKHVMRGEYIDMEDFLISSFIWNRSIKGHDYWKSVANSGSNQITNV